VRIDSARRLARLGGSEPNLRAGAAQAVGIGVILVDTGRQNKIASP
jgi:hypothetical protein